MRRISVVKDTLSLPDELIAWIGNSPIYESSGESGARTLYIERDGGAYLKIAENGSLYQASIMQEYLYRNKLSSRIINYLSADKDYLITAALDGEDGTSEKYLSDPERLSEVFAHSLRYLHGIDILNCPVKEKMAELIKMAEKLPFRQSHIDSISAYIGKADAGEAAEEIALNKSILKSDVCIHGDYCLPNIILKNWELNGFIDVADGGVGDRHYDLAWGLWTLNHNLKSHKYGRRFLDAYGRGDIDEERLRICGLLAAME